MVPYKDYALSSERDAQDNIADQKVSSGYWESFTTYKTRKRVLQCKADTLLTQYQKFRFKLQTEPYCTMCKAKKKIAYGTVVTHTLGQGTQHEGIVL